MSRLRLALAGAAVAAALAPVAPVAAYDPYPPEPIGVGQCTVHWRPLYVFSDDVPFTPYIPYCVW